MDKNEDKKKNELEEVNLSKTQEILMKIIEKLDKNLTKKKRKIRMKIYNIAITKLQYFLYLRLVR